MKLGNRIRKAIHNDGRSLRKIALTAQIDVGLLSRFMHGRSGLSLESAERLVAVLGLELVPRSRRTRR